LRECPRCGFKDNSYWRHVPHSLYRDYCHISELETFDQSLAAALVTEKTLVGSGNVLMKDGYIYHLTKAGYVSRIHVSDSVDGISWEEADRERTRRPPHPSQRLLIGEVKTA